MIFRSPQLRVLTGSFCISFSAIFVRLVEVPSTTSGFYRVLLGGLALSLYMLVRRQRLNFTRDVWMLLALCAVFFAADLWFWHRSINAIGPGLATLLASLQVIFVTLFAFAFMNRRPTLRQWIAIPVALLGLALIVGIDWSSLSADYRLGVIFGLLTALSYALYLLALRAVQEKTRSAVPVAELAVLSLLTAGIMAISAAVEGESLAIVRPIDGAWLLAYALLAHVVGWLLITSAIAKVSPSIFALSLLFQPMLSFLWEILLFSRGLTALEILGAVLTLGAIVIGGVQRRAQRRQA